MLAGSESTTMQGQGPSLHLGKEAELSADKVRIFAKDAWVSLDKNVRMKGDLIKLNCDEERPSDLDDEAAPTEKKRLKLKLSDATFTAYGDRKYQIVVDGATYEGTTSAEGIVDKEIPKDAKSVQLVVWIGDYPTGEKRTWTLTMEAIPPATEASGAQTRLSNLGYRSGAATGLLDDDTVKALASFQSDAGLAPTGELDAATAAALIKAHGS